MSIRVPLSDLKDNDIESFEKYLLIEENTRQNKQKKVKFPWMVLPKYNTVRRDPIYVYLPFQWGMNYFAKKYRTPREDCQPIKISFQGTLREEQKVILKETIDMLNQNGSCMMAIYPGGGKCLAKGTRVLQKNGNSICVENIKIGDILVGDDYQERMVKSTCRGFETMYRVQHKYNKFLKFSCNQSHILTLWDNTEFKIIDIPLKKYLELSSQEQGNYYGLYQDFDGPDFNIEEKRRLIKKLATEENTLYTINVNARQFYEMLSTVMLCGLVMHPSTTAEQIIFSDNFCVLEDFHKRVQVIFPMIIEKVCIGEYYGFELDQNGRFMLANGIVTHNTITSLAIAGVIKLKTLILVNKIVLVDQWIETIKRVYGTHARIQQITTKTKINPGCQFYIMNALNVAKRDSKDYEKLGIGFVIVDECHLIMTKIFSRALGYICPRYLIGLSATPYRPDGFDTMLELYFGLRKVVRKLYREHQVYFWETNIKIVAEKDNKGQLLWNTVIDAQTNHQERNNNIISICQKHSDRNILILSKRIHQIETIHDGLREKGEHVTLLKDGETSFDKSARILIATFQKVGTGFSHDKLDMLILATDAEEYFIQYLGRVFRRPDVQPIILDIVDDNPILRRHFLTRKNVYQECGGKIFPYKL
jgi:superfamily II DNA or RNA helicase